jgi:uncharacterized membrane protein YdjX (TVP38/TMEM64 family)
MNRHVRYFPLLLLGLVTVTVWASGATRYMHMHVLREHAATLHGLAREHPALSLAAFVVVLAVMTASSLPGVIPILMLTGGYLFGTWIGGLASAAGLTLGAALVFAAIRSSFGAIVREKAERAGGRMKALLGGVQSGGFGYVLSLRLIPFAPFELVSIAAALAGIPLGAYLLGTVLGVLPATLIYGGVGAGIGKLIDRGETPRLHALLTPALVVPLLALGLFSLTATLVVHRRAQSKGAEPPA